MQEKAGRWRMIGYGIAIVVFVVVAVWKYMVR